MGSRQANSKFLGCQEQGHQLLPGIPDDITFNQISPKLPWKTFYILSSVSRGWKEGIQSRKIYDARVRSQSTETLVLINCFGIGERTLFGIGLYSARDKTFYQLPQIPNFGRGIPLYCQCISLGGRVYVLGGYRNVDFVIKPSEEVYMMDLAAHRQWEQCASMKRGRSDFGLGVMDGKIYVFGGLYGVKPVFVSEVYDPKFDIWQPIKSSLSLRFQHQVTAMGEELFLHGGSIFTYPELWTEELDLDHDDDDDDYDDNDAPNPRMSQRALFSDVYHPGKDEWRKVENFEKENVFMAQGKLHTLNMRGIDVYDSLKNSWTRRHLFSLAGIGRAVGQHSSADKLWSTLAVDDELVTTLHTSYGMSNGRSLLYSTGFGGRKKQIVWQKAECSFVMGYEPAISPVQL